MSRTMTYLPSLGLDVLILYSKLSATKCVIFPSSTRTDPCGNEASKCKFKQIKKLDEIGVCERMNSHVRTYID